MKREVDKMLGNTPQSSAVLPYIALALGIGSLYTLLQVTLFDSVERIEWHSVVAEGVVLLLLFPGLVITVKGLGHGRHFSPLLIGFAILLLAATTDLLDEFLQQPEWITTLFEDLAQITGVVFLVIGLWRWYSQNQKLLQELRESALCDYLTGALNRRGFNLCIEEEIERANRYYSPLSLITFDLDHFKQINDQYGHEVGDEVLATIARQVIEKVRRSDVFARMGGEEFAILMPETELEQAVGVAEKLRREFELCTFDSGVEVAASFGVGQYRQGEKLDDLLKRVDDALYRAKDMGRNRVEREEALLRIIKA